MTRPISLARAAALLSVLLASACSLEPDYRRPAAPVQDSWPAADSTAGSTAAADIGWHDFFHDESLQRLIALALANNLDLRVVALNVGQAQAKYRVQHADLFPAIDTNAVEQVERYPSGVLASGAGAGAAGGGTVGGATSGTLFRNYDVGLGFTSYELDLFGRIRSLGHAALEQYFSAEETRRATQLTLIAEIASGYFRLLADEAALALTRSTLEAQQGSYDLARKNFELGNGTELAVRQAQTTVETARANLATQQRQLAQDRDALVLLLGVPLPVDLKPGSDLASETLDSDLPAGISSIVLANRPDILASEHQLQAANASIGAARAAFFPSIALTGSYGTAATQLTGLFLGGSQAWSFSPQITVPIFTAGANQANLDLVKLEKDAAVAQYEKAIQTGFREVADALAARRTFDDQLTAQVALLEAAGRAFALADLRFRNGVDNYLTVLDAQRSLYAAQLSLVAVRLERLQNLATLYKALGGGVREYTAGDQASASPHA
jgi:multidrug efflux system outer membrane protein